MNTALERLKELTTKITSYELTRKENYQRLEMLFYELSLNLKVNNFKDLFLYKAINLSAISLQKESFGELQHGKYLQLLAISKVDGKSKNISLGYYGRVENVEKKLRDKIVEFVIRYRFEKSFLTLTNYHELLNKFQES